MRIVALSIFLLVALLSSAATNTVELPVETFFRYPELSQMSLAPDGKYLAAIAYDRTNSFLFGINLQSGERKAIFTGGVYHFRWLTNERLLFWAGGVGAGGLYAINRDGSKVKVLQLPYVTQILKSYSLHLQLVELLSVPPDHSDTMLIERSEYYLSERMKWPHPEVRRVNFITGKTSLEEKNPGNVVAWRADSESVIRAGLVVEGAKVKILYRRDEQ